MVSAHVLSTGHSEVSHGQTPKCSQVSERAGKCLHTFKKQLK